jgi:hypothetical protein
MIYILYSIYGVMEVEDEDEDDSLILIDEE